MRKITDFHRRMLWAVEHAGGSYCPHDGIDPAALKMLDDLVKAKRLSVEPNDGAPPRYSLTAYGRAELHG